MLWGADPALAVAAVTAVVVQQRVMLGQVGSFGWGTALAYPVTFATFVVVFARSAWLSLVRHEVSWRGRSIPLDRDARWIGVPNEAGGAS